MVSAATFPGGYAYSKSVTFKSLGIINTVTNFPVLLSLPASADLAITGTCADKVQNPNGPNYDLAFVDGSNNELNYQVDSYNKTTGALLVWVQIPSLNTNATFAMTFYFGAATPTHATGFSYQNTWATDYLAVYHFNESTFSASTGAVKDGSQNSRTATTTGMTATDLIAGNIGNAYNFGTGKKITSAATADLTGSYTLSAWVKTPSTGILQKIVTNQAATGGGYKMGIYTNNVVEAENRNAASTATNTSLTVNLYTVPQSAWTYVSVVYNSGIGANFITLVNGNQAALALLIQDATAGSVIKIGVDGDGVSNYFNGAIDEVRISNKPRSNAWLLAESTNQSNPDLYTTVGALSVVSNTLAAAIKGGLTYTWTGGTSTDPTVATNWTNTTAGVANQLPSLTSGNATLVIPASAPRYPTLTGNISLYGLTIGAGASLNLSTFTATVGCNIYNSSGGQILLGSLTSGITFNGTVAQSYNGVNTANTAQTGTLIVNNATGVTITGGPVDVYTALKMTSGNLVIDNPGIGNATGTGALTLKSTSTQTAYLDQIISSSTVTGWVTTERYAVGGAGHRGYRLFSSPVYTTTIGSTNGYGFKTIQWTSPITGWGNTSAYTFAQPTSGFDGSPTGNPSVFFYNEPSADPTDRKIVNSDYKGLNDINDVFPVGNGFLFFFRGNRNVLDGSGATKLSTAAVPENTTLKYYGTLNQGSISVYIPTSPLATSTATTALVYKTSNAASSLSTAFSNTPHTVTTNDGYHLVGNPYASTIDLDLITLSNAGGNSIYMLNNAGVMSAYIKGSGSTATPNGVGRYVLSGQGFLVKANTASTTTLTFTEACKINSVSVTGTTPFAIAANQYQQQQDLLIRLSADSVTANETLIHFNAAAQNNFNPMEDAYYNSGPSQTIYMASYTKDNKPCIINQMNGLDSVKTIPLYVEGPTTGTYKLRFTGASTLDPRYRLFLKDSFTNDSLDVSANDLYTLKIDRSNAKTFGPSRFYLSVQPTHIGDRYSLRSFDGIKKNNAVIINWKTAYEGTYTNFTLQRSTDGWKTVTDITTLRSNGTGDYSFSDMAPATDKNNEYRLVQTNIDNVISISKVITIGYQPADNMISKFEVYPNPAVNTIQVKLKDAASGTLYLKVYSVTGNLVLQTTGTAGSSITENVTGLLKGTYIISITDSNNKKIGNATFTKL